jgi:hypothetical protein
MYVDLNIVRDSWSEEIIVYFQVIYVIVMSNRNYSCQFFSFKQVRCLEIYVNIIIFIFTNMTT